MPPALDRLLASPSALRLLRTIVAAPELPACHATVQCCAAKSVAARRSYTSNRVVSASRKWRRWSEQRAVASEREDILKALLEEDAPIKSTPEAKVDDTNENLQESVGDVDAKWAARLAHHERLDGRRGIQAVWNARRKEGYRLPTAETADADFLWGTFSRHPKLVPDVLDHAVELLQESGQTYPYLYRLIMGYWLMRSPTDAREYHHQMLVKLRLRKLPLRELARLAQRYGDTALEVLLDVYRNSNERDLYDEIVPLLVDSGNIVMARRWHNLCTLREDLPSESVASNPAVQIFTAESAALSNPNIRFDKSKRENPKINKHLMHRLLGRDTAPVRFEDSFTARMFATKTIAVDSIIKGLTMVGVNEIGPQAVSAMAWRTQPVTELPRRFEDLRAAGVALQGCVFSLALEKFAMEQKWDLIRSILESDQHPDVYGQADTQRSLLDYYLEQEDWAQAQRTLAILTLFHNNPSRESWNLLLQLRIKRSGGQDVFNTLLEMRSHGITLSNDTMIAVKGILATRQRGHRPSARAGFDDLRFVTRFYMVALEAGMARVPPRAWREIIRRFGMQNRFRELKRLLLWLLCWYAPLHSTEFTHLPRSPFLLGATRQLQKTYWSSDNYFHFPNDIHQEDSEQHPVRILFPPSLLQGILVWGFRAGGLPNAHFEQTFIGSPAAKRHHRRSLLRKDILRRLDWTAGLKLVVQLRDLGVHVHEHTITKALQAQLVNLFGHGHSRIKANRILEQTNKTPYAEYVREANTIWGTPLLTEPQELGISTLGGHFWHPRFKRRVDMKGYISLKQTMRGEWAHGDTEAGPEADADVHTGNPALDELQRVADAQNKISKK